MGDARTCYFINQLQKTEDGEYIPCIAVEGESGYHPTDWAWGKDLALAEKIAAEKNAVMGISKEDAIKIVLGTMRNHS